MIIDKYFVCHYTKLSDRKPFVEYQLNKNSIDFEWILDFDQENINFETISKSYSNILSNVYLGRTLRKSEISLILKHEECLRKIVENRYQNTIIFEDDILLSENFINKLNKYCDQLPSDYDILWIGSCCDLHYSPIIEGINVYETNKGSRCTHAFLISLKCAEMLLNQIKNIYYPIDFFYNKMILDLNLKNFWAEPELVNQNKNYKSSIQPQ
jgi:GR25 family glycosyltransferase involved in LPS biosynthesis